MKEFFLNKENNVYCRIFSSFKEQKEGNSLCFFKVSKGEVLFELIKKDTNELLAFRIYNKKDINEDNIIDLLKKDKCFSEEIDEKYNYIAN
jgi:hypothetical protein